MFLGAAFLEWAMRDSVAPQRSEVVLAFQPGLLAAYHFGAAYVDLEGRAYVEPNPGALALLGGMGVNF
jgi:hypothetical protein